MTTFTCPAYPGLTIRAGDRVFKFAGGVLVASGRDAQAVVDFARAHPGYGVQPTSLSAPPPRKRKAKPKPELPELVFVPLAETPES